MQQVLEFSALLHEADILLQKIRSRRSNQLSTPEQRSNFKQRYQDWCELCREALPDDLRVQFEKELARAPAIPLAAEQSSWFSTIAFDIEDQRKIIASARLRFWNRTPLRPRKERRAIAIICKDAYQVTTIGERFIACGCEPHWYIPPFEPIARSERANLALGWLDGILVYAPEREATILGNLCEALLENERLSSSNRERIEQIFPLLQPAPPVDLLASIALHPTVRAIATPLVSIAHNDEAIFKVCVALDNEVQRRANLPNLDGSRLMTQAFTRDAPILRCAADSTEQQGWMYLFTGAIQALRNPRGHTLGLDTPLDQTIEWLVFLSALFRTLEGAILTTPPPSP